MRKIFAMAKTVFKGDLTENGSIILRPVPPKPCLETAREIAVGGGGQAVDFYSRGGGGGVVVVEAAPGPGGRVGSRSSGLFFGG